MRRSACSASSTRGARPCVRIPTSTASFRPAVSRPITALDLPDVRRFFLPVKVLSRVFRGKFVARSDALLPQPARPVRRHAALRDPKAWNAFVTRSSDTEWVVYAKPPSAEHPPYSAISGATPIAWPSPITGCSPSRRPVTFCLEGLRSWRRARTMTLYRHRVPPPLRPAHPAPRLRAHPAVGFPRERMPHLARARVPHATCRAVAGVRTARTRRTGHTPPRDVGLSTVRRGDDCRADSSALQLADRHLEFRHLMRARLCHSRRHPQRDTPRLRCGVSRAHDRARRAAHERRTRRPSGRRRRRCASPASDPTGSTLEDPDSSSIAGRRASGFL